MRLLRRIIRHLSVYALFCSGALWWAKRRAIRRNAVAVLTLHRVLPDSEFEVTSSLPGIVVRQRTFSELVACLRKYYSIIDLAEYPNIPGQNGRPRLALTFDDGWADNLPVGSGILRPHSVPAVVFICPGLMGRRFPFWPEKAVASYRLQEMTGVSDFRNFVEDLKSMPPASRDVLLATMPQPDGTLLEEREPMNATLMWEDVARLRDCGFSFGSHTWSHQILTQIAPAAVNRELSDSKSEIEARLKKPCETFAYPNGNCSEDVRDAVARNGYKLAFTTELGLWTGEHDSLRIPRVNISENYLVNLSGHFSRPMFEYRVFWCAGK